MANYFVNQGLAATTTALSSVITWLAVGTGTGAPAKTDTALGAAIVDSGLAAGAATVTQQTTTATNDTLRLAKTWTGTGNKAVTEIAAEKSDGTLYARCLFTSTKNVSNGDSLAGTINIVFV